MACGNNEVSHSGLHSEPVPHRPPALLAAVRAQESIQAERQRCDERVDQAHRAIERATAPADVVSAVADAQSAVDKARRAGVPKHELRNLERSVERLRASAGDKLTALREIEQQHHATLPAAHPLSRFGLGMPPTPRRNSEPRTPPPTDEVDRHPDQAIGETRESGVLPPRSLRGAYGHVAESGIAVQLVEHLGQNLIHQNVSPGDQGIDLVTHDEKTGSLIVWEVKSTMTEGGVDRTPPLGATKYDGRQMSSLWLGSPDRPRRLAAAGLDQAASTDVELRVVYVDLRSRPALAQVWIIDPVTGEMTRDGSPFQVEDQLGLRD